MRDLLFNQIVLAQSPH